MKNVIFKFITIILILKSCITDSANSSDNSTNSLCGSYVPKDITSCTLYSTDSNYCCYLRTFSNSFYSYMCYSLKPSEYINLNNKINLGGFEYEINCGNTIGTICGSITNPYSFKDCGMSSQKDNTCCYMEYQGITNCVWLGSGYKGKVEYKNLTLICGSEVLKKISIFVLLFLLLALI